MSTAELELADRNAITAFQFATNASTMLQTLHETITMPGKKHMIFYHMDK